MSGVPNAQLIEQERRRLSQRLDEVARLCEAGLPPAAFYGELMTRLLDSLAAVAGCVWVRTPQGNLQQQYQINMPQLGLDASEEARQGHDAILRLAFASGQPQHLPPNSSMGVSEEGKPAPTNPTSCHLLLVPIRNNEQVMGLLEIFQGPNRPISAVPGFIQYMQLMADLASRYQKHQLVGQLVGQQALWTALEAYARTIHGSLNTTEVAFLVVNEGRRIIECDRLAVAIRRRGERARVEAVSGCDVVEHRSNMIRRLRALCDAVFDWGERLVFQGTKDDALPPKVLETLDSYLQESPSKLLVIAPLHDERDGDGKTKPKQPPRSALIMECFETPAEPEQTIARLDVIARHATPALYNAVEYRRIPFRFLWMPLARLQEGLGGKTKAIVMAIVVAVSLLGAALYALPYPLKLESTGQVLPVVRRTLYSPTMGTIRKFEVEPGAIVPERFSLALLYDTELFQKYSTLDAEIRAAKLEADERERRVENASEADKQDRRIQAARARAEEMAKRRELLELISRTNARPDRPGEFNLLAPVMTEEERRRVQDPRWLVLTSNFKEQVGNLVRPSDPIMRLGAKNGPWEIEMKIPQKHIGQILRAYQRLKPDMPQELDVDFLLLSDPLVLLRAKLHRDRIAGETTPKTDDPNDNEPYVLAYARIDGDDIPEGYRLNTAELASGVGVRAKIYCGNMRAGYSLFYGVWEFLYEKVIFFLF